MSLIGWSLRREDPALHLSITINLTLFTGAEKAGTEGTRMKEDVVPLVYAML